MKNIFSFSIISFLAISYLFFITFSAITIKDTIIKTNVQYVKIDDSAYIAVKSHSLQNFPKPKISVKKETIVQNPMTQKPVKYSFKLYRISAYTNSVQETDSTPYNTSCGHVNDVKYKPIIAVSRDIFFYKGYKWLCGKIATIVYSDGSSITGVIYDTMNSRYRNTADVLIRKNTLTKARIAAFEHGVKTGKLHVY